jgi:hypothetical protein
VTRMIRRAALSLASTNQEAWRHRSPRRRRGTGRPRAAARPDRCAPPSLSGWVPSLSVADPQPPAIHPVADPGPMTRSWRHDGLIVSAGPKIRRLDSQSGSKLSGPSESAISIGASQIKYGAARPATRCKTTRPRRGNDRASSVQSRSGWSIDGGAARELPMAHGSSASTSARSSQETGKTRVGV